MRRIAVINQKGGVGKTTTTANLGAALAQQGRRVVIVDMDAQANLSLSLNVEAGSDAPSTYTVLNGATSFAQALRPTAIANLTLMPSNIDLSGAELELASAIGREYLMKDALARWESEARAAEGRAPADYVVFDCPPSLGLLSINALAAAGEVLITLQTEFLALQGMSKLVEIVQLLRRRLNPELVITGILPCLYDSRLKLAREVLGEIRAYFPGQVFPNPVRTNVKLAEAPSYGKTIFEYAPDSNGAADYRLVAREVIAREPRDPDLASLPAFRDAPAVSAPYPAGDAAAAASGPKKSVASARGPASATPAATAAQPVAPAQLTIGASNALECAEVGVPALESVEIDLTIRPSALEAAESAIEHLVSTEHVADSRPTSALEPIAPATRSPSAREPEANDDAERPASAELRDVVLTPARRPNAAGIAPIAPVASVPERRILRAEDLPPLPPDAFEILTSYVNER